MQSYILTYYRLRKRELLIALGSHQGAIKDQAVVLQNGTGKNNIFAVVSNS